MVDSMVDRRYVISKYMDEITKNWHFSEGPHIPEDCGRAKPTLGMSPQLGVIPHIVEQMAPNVPVLPPILC